MSIREVWGVLLLILMGTATVCAQEIDVPVDVQVPLFLKILSFDRNLKTRSGKEVVIGVIYQGKMRASLKAMEEFIAAVNTSPPQDVGNIPVRCVPIEVGAGSDVASTIATNNVNILYITPLRAVDMVALAGFCRSKQVPALTGVAEYIQSGAAVSIGIKGDRPEIVVNLPVAKAEGMDFDSQLLKLAKIIQ
jgi:hypothetical protein